MFMLRQSGERFAGYWAGTRESALRTVAALRIIDAAELARALDVAHKTKPAAAPVLPSTRKRERCANEKLTLFLIVAATLAGCGENTPVQTVDWYKAHDAE